MEILLVVNPVSGRGQAPKLAKTFVRLAMAQGHLVQILTTRSPVNIQAEIKMTIGIGAFETVIVCGGDGLVHEVTQVLQGTNLILGVIAAGTGNDFASENGEVFRNITRLLAVISSGKSRLIDLGEISTFQKKFVQVLSTGFDSQVNRVANNYKLKIGKIKYVLATLQIIFRFKALDYSITYDGKTRIFQAMLVAVANGRSYGGGMQIVPHAERDDGKLDVLILHPVSKIELLRVFPKVFKGRHVTHPAVEFVKVASIKIDSESQIYADGEYIGTGPIEVKCHPSSLRIWSGYDY
jgi:diacylglycerol kinase (ATP)